MVLSIRKSTGINGQNRKWYLKDIPRGIYTLKCLRESDSIEYSGLWDEALMKTWEICHNSFYVVLTWWTIYSEQNVFDL